MNKFFSYSITLPMLFLICQLHINAQTRHSFDSDVFISHLMQENIMEIKDTVTNKYVSGFKYLESITIELDTIVEIGNVSNLVIYKFQLGMNKINIKSKNLKILFNASSCNTYIMAINSEKKTVID